MIKKITTIGIALLLLKTSLQAQTTFSNSTSVTINDNAPASLYPSPITVSGMSGVTTNITVVLKNVTHSFVHDMSVILQAPTGESLLLQSGVADGFGVSNITYTFSDAGAAQMSSTATISNATYKPTGYFQDIWPAPAPLTPPGLNTYGVPGPFGIAPFSTLSSKFNGLNPNGQWKLFIADFASGDGGVMSGGWSLNVTTSGFAVPLTFTSFNANCNTNNVDLNWSYENEMNLHHFEVLKSNDAKTFVSIANVEPKGINTANLYNDKLDAEEVFAKQYYQIKAVDNDNNFTLSTLKEIQCNNRNEFDVFPTIVNDIVTIRSEINEIKYIEISNAVGDIVFSTKLDDKVYTTPISLSNLVNGIYFVKTVLVDDVIKTTKIVKQ